MTTKANMPGPWRRLVRYFVAGAFTVLPLAITIVAISWAIGFLAGLVGPDTFLGRQFSNVGLQFVTSPVVAYGIGWLSLLAVVVVVGFLVESGLRGFVGRVLNTAIRHIPLVGKVYDTSQQLVDMLDAGGDDKMKGMSVVYCSFDGHDGVGVLALLPKKDVITIEGSEFYVVLVPQSPVPIGGGLLFMPVESVRHVDMSVDTLMSIYVSMGAVAPASLVAKSMTSHRGRTGELPSGE